jgi:S-DNA-T family DNA segregation ATPase FtsK/SpoIIIE
MKMANKTKDKKRVRIKDKIADQPAPRSKSIMKEEAWYGIWSVLFFIIAFFLILAAIGKSGPAGDTVYTFFNYLFGVGYYLLPVISILLAVSYLSQVEKRLPLSRIIGSTLFVASGLGLLHIIDTDLKLGGVVGGYIGQPLISLFDGYVASAFLIGFLLISCFVIFNTRLKKSHFPTIFGTQKDEAAVLAGTATDVEKSVEKVAAAEEKKNKEDMMKVTGTPVEKPLERKEVRPEDMLMGPQAFSLMGKKFAPPPLSILEQDKGKPGVGDIKANANIIKRTLQNFGIDVEMDEISIGPSVTRYALKPAEGVKLSRILGLQNNLALALAAHPIRIEAPIPGKSLVGIEIPNSVKTTVGLGTLLGSPEYKDSDKPLLASLGKGISGKSHFADIASMPHALIAGTTGSGKSVTIHAIITSLLYRNSPENLRFIMIDPKRVELTLYNKIPHLLTPVITDAKKAILSLKWAAKEMDRRYNLLEKNAVRDIGSYHKTILAPEMKKMEEKIKRNGGTLPEGETAPETMPYIIVVIDELADIMQTYPRELEAGIVRLAQMSRAVGIHLILSTQRPSVNVITGLIKANVPTRIALQVASQIDSRTILDGRGAEELLGAGDMLYLSSKSPNPERIQSAYITETEVKNVVKYLADNYDSLPSEINITGENVTKDVAFDSMNLEGSLSSDDDEADDDLYDEAKDLVVKSGKASTSYLQRKLSIGYGRAARIMDILEEKGVIGPANGSKPRDVVGFQGAGASADEETG